MTHSTSYNASDLSWLVIRAVRREHLTGEAANTLRNIARIVSRAKSLCIETKHLDILLAAACNYAQPEGFLPDWPAEVQDLFNLVGPVNASPLGLEDRIMRDFPADPKSYTIDTYFEAAQAYFDARLEEMSMTEEEASTLIRSTVEQVAKSHPELNLSFGYIGNIWWQPYRDDRSFKVFTTLATLQCQYGCDVSFGGHSVSDIGVLAHLVRNKLADWAADQASRLAEGKLRQVKN